MGVVRTHFEAAETGCCPMDRSSGRTGGRVHAARMGPGRHRGRGFGGAAPLDSPAVSAAPRKTVYYTFGNHMHWVDMEWLWGYHVLPGSVRDMLRLCRDGGVQGNVNFDAVGYEKMAAECPEALAELRQALADGVVEVVGGSYGQPYGLFQGGESNVRQRVYGIRSCLRTLGARPRAFWEEEFDFCPQLPQILQQCGYEGACLFFQWTWHTPELPMENAALVLWEGLDGTRLPALPRNELNLHQWPEDFAPLLESPLLRDLAAPAVVQWVELMPSPDWMCRSELLLPKLLELQARLHLRATTLSGLLRAVKDAGAPLRRYTLDDVWHGVTLGKNGDCIPRWSRRCERQALAAEAIAALAGLFGRPYPSWDVYPVWELEEAWRELLAAQHHDNHECEGLCGFVGKDSFARAHGLAERVYRRTLRHLAARVQAPAGATLVYNPLGWTRDVALPGAIAPSVPPFGYRVAGRDGAGLAPARGVTLEKERNSPLLSLVRGDLRVSVERRSGRMTAFRCDAFPGGVLELPHLFPPLEMVRDGQPERFDAEVLVEPWGFGSDPGIHLTRRGRDGAEINAYLSLHPIHDALQVVLECFDPLPRPDGGLNASLCCAVAPAFRPFRLIHDHPYGVSAVRAEGVHRRKYPSGDWMTSPQWFETVRRPFTASSFVDLLAADGERGLLLVHDGSQAFFRGEDGVRAVLSAYDPWDEDYFDGALRATLWLLPHGPLGHARRMRLALELGAPEAAAVTHTKHNDGGDLPPEFSGPQVDAPNVLVTAFYRETEHAGEHLPDWAGRGMGYPYVVRLVEFDGAPAQVTLRLPGPAARAVRTNLMGEAQRELAIVADAVSLTLRPHEIATVYLDLVQGRKQARDLDAHRKVWASVHRTPE